MARPSSLKLKVNAFVLLHPALVHEFTGGHHHLVMVCAIFGVGDVGQAVVKVLSNPEPLELGLVTKAGPHLFLISRLPVRNVVTTIQREIVLVKSSSSNQ